MRAVHPPWVGTNTIWGQKRHIFTNRIQIYSRIYILRLTYSLCTDADINLSLYSKQDDSKTGQISVNFVVGKVLFTASATHFPVSPVSHRLVYYNPTATSGCGFIHTHTHLMGVSQSMSWVTSIVTKSKKSTLNVWLRFIKTDVV